MPSASPRPAYEKGRSSSPITPAVRGAIDSPSSRTAGASRAAALEAGDQPPERAPEAEAGNATPRRADRALEACHLALPVDEQAADRRILRRAQRARMLHEERPRHRRRHI